MNQKQMREDNGTTWSLAILIIGLDNIVTILNPIDLPLSLHHFFKMPREILKMGNYSKFCLQN